MSIPEIKDLNGIPTLYVQNEPFLAFSGEIHNSSASSLEYMEKEVWPRLKGLNMNSVIVPIYWEVIEPVEGEFHYDVIDGLIEQAKVNGMKLILLWFGLWKNAESMYVPSWMKKDTETYFRVRKVNGEPINTISPLCEAAVEKDANAFANIMAHIKSVDEAESTVIIMQVENEIGVLGTARDYSDAANAAFKQEVPAQIRELCDSLCRCDDSCCNLISGSGSWKEVFGDNAEEYFMAYYFAKAVEKITSAGRDKYPLPCYANAWLYQYPWYVGSYPSGGPVIHVHPIWKKMAPSLFSFGPDIYVPYVAKILDEYGYEGNPLMVPEVRKDAVTASYCLYAFGAKNAICYSPFGIEELTMDPSEVDKPPMEVMIALNIDPSAFDIAGSKDYLAKTYQLLNDMKPLYLKYRGTDRLKCYVKKDSTDFGTFLYFQHYNLQVAYSPQMPNKPLAAGMVYELAPDRFLLIGMMSTLTFMPKCGENLKADFMKIEEGTLENGEWKAGRILNGDEKMSLNFSDMPTCYMLELFKY